MISPSRLLDSMTQHHTIVARESRATSRITSNVADIIPHNFHLHNRLMSIFCTHYYTTTMPPKRPSKRRGDEEDSRPSKKGGKKSKEPTYDTYDECLDGESSPLFLAGG
jgi:hypothetical protein